VVADTSVTARLHHDQAVKEVGVAVHICGPTFTHGVIDLEFLLIVVDKAVRTIETARVNVQATGDRGVVLGRFEGVEGVSVGHICIQDERVVSGEEIKYRGRGRRRPPSVQWLTRSL
jgi:hypothetical protein